MSRDPLQFDNIPLSETRDDVKEKVADITSRMKDRAGQVAGTMSEKIEQGRENAAEGLNRAATALHDKASSVPGGAKVVNFTHTIADGMESTASYLRDHDFSQMGKDVMDTCRRYPTQTLVAALAVGFLLGRSRR